MIKFRSDTTGQLVIGEGSGLRIRELDQTEKVHCRDDINDTECSKCGKSADIWLYSETQWTEHPQRCLKSGVSWLKAR